MNDNQRFSRLLEPGLIGKVKTKNRLVKTAQGSSVIEPDTGFVGERALAYYENLVKGGVGLLLTESCGVEYPLGTHHPPASGDGRRTTSRSRAPCRLVWRMPKR